MTTAIICPGPTLMDEWAARTASPEVIIAVNGAADLIACDWWVIGDIEAFQIWPTVMPGLGIFHQTHTRAIPRHLRGSLLKHWDDLRCPRHPLPFHSSMQAALALASRFCGHAPVEVYGATWSGTGYACRHIASADDLGGRWEHERKHCEATAATFGITFKRMTRCKKKSKTE